MYFQCYSAKGFDLEVKTIGTCFKTMGLKSHFRVLIATLRLSDR